MAVSQHRLLQPIFFDESGLIKIRSVLPSGKMSKIRTIEVERQKYSLPVAQPKGKQVQGLNLKIADVKCTYAKELESVKEWKDSILTSMCEIAHLRPNFFRNVVYHVAVTEGYVKLPADGIYQFKSNNTRVWINGRLVVDNDNKPQIHSTTSRMLALRAGIYPIKVEQISNFIGGWNAQHRNSRNVSFKLDSDKKWTAIDGELMVREVD